MAKICRKGFEVAPMKSGAGYYLGTRDNEGFPYCRISSGYARTEEEAERVLSPDRVADEILFCNGGCGCGIHEVEK